jgi:hypothetical protein
MDFLLKRAAVRLSRTALAAEILGQLGGGALHRVSVGLGVVMAAAVDETVLRIWIGNQFEGTASRGRVERTTGE